MEATYIEMAELGIDESDVAIGTTPVARWWNGEVGDEVVSDGQLIPDETQAELITIRDRNLQDCFRIGDIANEMVERAAEIGFKVQAYRVRRAVGRFAGKTERTVRYYSETAAYYVANDRTHYDILPFSHFVFARSMGVRWREVLDYSMENPSVTVSELQRHFLEDYQGDPGAPVSVWKTENEEQPDSQVKDVEANREACELSQNYEGLAAPIPENAVRVENMNIFGDLLCAVDRAREAIESSMVPDRLKTEFGEKIVELRSLVSDILAAIR